MPAFGYNHKSLVAEMFMETFDYEANLRGYIGQQLMPIQPVELSRGEYYKIDKEHLLKKRPDDRMSPEGTFNEVSFTWGYDSYNTEDRGLEFRLTDREKALHGDGIALEAIGAKMLNGMLAESHEADVIALVNAETGTAASAVWTTTSTDIIGNVEAAVSRLNAKLIPINPASLKLVVHRDVWLGMRKNVGILDTFGSSERTDSREATKARIADILEVGEILVVNTWQNAVPDLGTFAATNLWTKTKAALVVTGTGANDGSDVRWGNTLIWKNAPPRFERYMKENKTAEVMRQRIDRAQKVVCSGAIEVITGVAA